MTSHCGETFHFASCGLGYNHNLGNISYNLNLFLCGLGYKILNDPISYCHLWLIFLYIVGRQWKIDQYVVAGFRNVSHKNALLMKK